MRSKILWVSAFRNAICNTTYLFWESPCQYLTFIWHFEMLIICNANISIPGAMRNANVMQMKCNANKCEKCIILGAIQYLLLALELIIMRQVFLDSCTGVYCTLLDIVLGLFVYSSPDSVGRMY